MPGTRLLGSVRRVAQGRTRYRQLLAERDERRATDARAAAYRLPIDASQVFYESFDGNGMLCNPEAIFRRLLDAPDLQHLHHVWALDDLGKHAAVVERFAADPRVTFVERRSVEYVRRLATSGYVVNNATLPPEFAKRDGQVYLNTWHGVPLKKMGYDLPDGPAATRNVLRNMVSADYLLSANAFMTDRMYRQAFRLEGVFHGTVIEEGQPRTDLQWQTRADRRPVVTELERSGLEIGDRRLIVYAPTWKGQSSSAPEANSQQLVGVVRQLQAAVDPDRYVVLLKAHQVIYDAVAGSGDGRDVLVPNDLPTNALLGATDMLVTDYSSIFFDFLVSGRPIFHHVPDLDQYASRRGLYLEDSELPGPLSRSIDELVAQVRAATAGPWEPDERYRRAAAAYAPHEDGSVADRVVDLVFRGADPDQYRTVRLTSPRPTLLVYVGGLQTNGLTTSALNLLRNLDHDRFDVSVLYHHHARNQRERSRNQGLIDPRCRHFVRTGAPLASTREVRRERQRLERGVPEELPADHVDYWRREWRRVFGHARFDHALDLSGYGASVPFLFINGEVGQRSIWLHSDLAADARRESGGTKHLEDRLHAVFTTYRHLDHLVSVSEELSRLNAANLSAYAAPEKFVFASNTIDHHRVLRMAGRAGAGASPRARDHGGAVPEPSNAVDTSATFDTTNVSAAVRALLEHFDAASLLAEVRSHVRMSEPRTGSGPVFVTVGRLSPEKNHARLVRAFAKVWEHAPGARLVIVGSGRLEGELKRLVRTLGLQDAVTLAGQVENPYVIMANADCFVMSSDYEGQPMVVLEARTLGLPVISTRFGSVAGSVPPAAGLVVDQSDEALADGMRRFMAGEVSGSPLDGDAYNADAMRQLYAAIGATQLVTRPA